MIPLFKPELDDRAISWDMKRLLASGWIGLGRKTEEFEKQVAEYLGVKEFVATNSCTAALHMAVRSLGLQKGTKVITSPITFVATNMVLLYEDLEPLFVDVEPRTGNIQPEAIERALEIHETWAFPPGAIIVVHMGGLSANMAWIKDISEKYGIPVVEDCAHAFGGYYHDEKKIGNTDNICCWSFHAVKNLPVGDGGGISTNDQELANRLRRMRWFGIDKSTYERTKGSSYSWDYNIEEIGYKYHMNDVSAVIGLNMLKHVDVQNELRRSIARSYMTRLKDTVCLKPGFDADYLTRLSSCHFLQLFFEDRYKIIEKLKQNRIQFGMHYKRNDMYPPFKQYKSANALPGADWYERHELTLPMYPSMTQSELDFIVDAVNCC